MREYKADINDPTTPKMVKKALQQDLDELDKVLDLYLNNFSDFQNKVNQMINEDITVKEGKLTVEPIKESYDDYGEEFTEDRAWKNKMMDYEKEYNKNWEKVRKLKRMKKSTDSEKVKATIDKKIEAIYTANRKLLDDFDKIASGGDVHGDFGGPVMGDISDDYRYQNRFHKGELHIDSEPHRGYKDNSKKKEPGCYKKLQDVLKECTESEACDFIESAVFDGYLEEIALEPVDELY
jgi:hypothetical protein